jgi:hypothetical protein
MEDPMTLGGIHPGDIVQADVKGRIFYATVETGPLGGAITVRPHDRNVTWRNLTARQIVGHYRKRAGSR